ncbi:unnamed protein product [Coffea canephora]|uniref:Uncharacterized protein n=1 Tax=Coffea canephora TaxID=49390 RepID=A0A068TLR9_COFCA|nr:unnamed protein product [Coffea canephora]
MRSYGCSDERNEEGFFAKILIKLSQGEYVAVEHLEKIYCVSPTIEDASLKFLNWVYGDSFKSMLIVVVVPNEESTVKWAQKIDY